MVVGERRGGTTAEIDAVRRRGAMVVSIGGESGRVHAGEEVLRPSWCPASGGVGDPASPLEYKGQGGER